MGGKKAFRSIAAALLLCVCAVSSAGPAPAPVMPVTPDMEIEGNDPDEDMPKERVPFENNPEFRGVGYGADWNYSLTFNYATRPLWLYGNNRKIVFRQKLEYGKGTADIQLTLWGRYAYDELAICMEPAALDALARAGVKQILLRNGVPGEAPEKETLYLVEDLRQLMSRAGAEPGNVLQLWVGESTGPRLVLNNWTRIQMGPEDDPGQEM